jgi:hypothetical protein
VLLDIGCCMASSWAGRGRGAFEGAGQVRGAVFRALRRWRKVAAAGARAGQETPCEATAERPLVGRATCGLEAAGWGLSYPRGSRPRHLYPGWLPAGESFWMSAQTPLAVAQRIKFQFVRYNTIDIFVLLVSIFNFKFNRQNSSPNYHSKRRNVCKNYRAPFKPSLELFKCIGGIYWAHWNSEPPICT